MTEIFRPGLLEGRTALVTGGGSGIGYGIARELASAGARVAIASRDLEKLERAASELAEETGGTVRPYTLNVREPAVVRETVDRVAGEMDGLHVLVNNAAGNFYCPSEELSPNAWKAVVETDLDGTFFCSQAAFPHMEEAGWGRIVSVSMTLHYRGWPKMAHATAAKAGVDALTRTLALEWADRGIRVNAVAPGPIPTEGVKEAFGGGASGAGSGGEAGADDAPGAGGEDAGGRHDSGFARIAIPAGRLGRPQDIGRMVTYLCSPGGDWITGAVFVVDGGEWLQKASGIPGAGGSSC